MEKRIIVYLPHGLQARVAKDFVEKASSFCSKVIILKDNRTINAKSIMGVMASAIKRVRNLSSLLKELMKR